MRRTFSDRHEAPAAVRRFASLLDGLYESWLDDPVSRPIADRDLADGQHRNPDPVDRPGSFTTACFHTPAGLAAEVDAAGFAGVTVYRVEGPGRPLRQEWANGRRREQILSASRPAETGPSLSGLSDHLIAAAAQPRGRPPTQHSLADADEPARRGMDSVPADSDRRA